MNGIANRILAGHASRLATLTALFWALRVRLHAAAAGNLPWERPMQTIATPLPGPVAFAMVLMGIGIVGAPMLWGGDLAEFGRGACVVGLVGSVPVFAAPML